MKREKLIEKSCSCSSTTVCVDDWRTDRFVIFGLMLPLVACLFNNYFWYTRHLTHKSLLNTRIRFSLECVCVFSVLVSMVCVLSKKNFDHIPLLSLYFLVSLVFELNFDFFKTSVCLLIWFFPQRVSLIQRDVCSVCKLDFK